MRPKRWPVSRAGALAHEADDAGGDEAGDLHHGEGAAVGEGEDEAVSLVGLARLVEGGVEEAARVVGDAGDPAGERGAVHVAVEDVHEDADPGARLGAEAELGRRRGGDRRDDAVGRADDRPSQAASPAAGRGRSRRTRRSGRARAAARKQEEEERQRRRGEAGDEAPALPVHRLDYTRKQRHRPSHSPLACGGDGIFARPEQYRSAARDQAGGSNRPSAAMRRRPAEVGGEDRRAG